MREEIGQNLKIEDMQYRDGLDKIRGVMTTLLTMTKSKFLQSLLFVNSCCALLYVVS